MRRPDAENVFVGISLAKDLQPRGVQDAVKLALSDFSASRVLFLIADELEYINLRALSPAGTEKLTGIVERRAAALEEVVQSGMASLDASRLGWTTSRWNDILNAEYWRLYTDLLGLFVRNMKFQIAVNEIAEEFSRRRIKEAPISDGQLQHLSFYVIAELPTIMAGVRVGAKRFASMIYPATSTFGLDRIAEGLQTGEFGLKIPKTCAIRKIDL